MRETKPQGRDLTALGVRHLRGFTLVELMIVVAILGVLAAIAIPSFTKSVRRARTSEALTGVRRIFDGSVVYFDRDHTDPYGAILVPQFPAAAGPTPDFPPPGIKMEPDPALWEHPTWQALDFAMSDPHYFAFGYDSPGATVPEDAWFIGAAFGDLDGDGISSRFARGGSVIDGLVRGYAGVVRIQPLE